MKTLLGRKMSFGIKFGLTVLLSLMMFAGCSKKQEPVKDEVSKEVEKAEELIEGSSSLSNLHSDLEDVGEALEKVGTDVAESDEIKSLLDSADELVKSGKKALDDFSSSDFYNDTVKAIVDSDEYKQATEEIEKAKDALNSFDAEELNENINSAMDEIKSSEAAQSVTDTLDSLSKAAEDAGSKSEETKAAVESFLGELGL